VQDAVRVQVQHALDGLVHEVAGLVLGQHAAVGLEVALQLTVVAHLQDQVHIVAVLKVVVQLKYKYLMDDIMF